MKFSYGFLSAFGPLVRTVRRASATVAIALVALAALDASAIGQDVTDSPATPTNAIAATGPESAASPAVPPAAIRQKSPARKPFRSARLTYLEGDVRVEHSSQKANSLAVLNMPLVEGTVISSGADGQAEIEFEDGSLARLTPNSGLSLAHLSVDSSGNYQTRITLLGGLAYLELRAGTKYIYSVEVGGDVISPVENATIRVNFDEPPASVAVLDGTAHFASAATSFVEASAGQTVEVDPSSDGSVLVVKSAIAPESWDRWNEDRDAMAGVAASSETDARTKFAGNQGYGWSDLDANGSWYDVPGHGEVWQPDIAAEANGDNFAGETQDQGSGESQNLGDGAGFDPYSFGNWAWTPAGYAWASGYGWGWLPYRCGFWSFYSGFGWGWSPDPYCGVYGFGGYGYGGFDYGDGGINILYAPRIYKRPHRPIPGPGPFHPILRGPGQGGPKSLNPPHRIFEERVIAGNTVRSLQPVGTGFAVSNGGTLGAGLRRDYPVDAKTRIPVTGLVPVTRGVPVGGSYARRLPPLDPQDGEPLTGRVRGNYEPQPIYLGPGQNRVERPGQNTFGRPLQNGVDRPVQNGGARPMQNESRPAPVQRQAAPPPAPHYSPPPPAPVSHSAPAAPASSPKGK